jgi:hypothetical protein
MGRWLAALFVLTISAPALADDESAIELRVPTKVSGLAAAASEAPVEQPAARPKKRASVYGDVLSTLTIARDLQIPGAPLMAVRLLPTSRALSGESSTPIVLRPRVSGGGSGYGVDIAAQF